MGNSDAGFRSLEWLVSTQSSCSFEGLEVENGESGHSRQEGLLGQDGLVGRKATWRGRGKNLGVASTWPAGSALP